MEDNSLNAAETSFTNMDINLVFVRDSNVPKCSDMFGDSQSKVTVKRGPQHITLSMTDLTCNDLCSEPARIAVREADLIVLVAFKDQLPTLANLNSELRKVCRNPVLLLGLRLCNLIDPMDVSGISTSTIETDLFCSEDGHKLAEEMGAIKYMEMETNETDREKFLQDAAEISAQLKAHKTEYIAYLMDHVDFSPKLTKRTRAWAKRLLLAIPAICFMCIMLYLLVAGEMALFLFGFFFATVFISGYISVH